MKRFVCIDLEMSQLTPEQMHMVGGGLRSEVIQIGATMLDENYNMISSFNSYVKPRYSSVTHSIYKLTGITNAMLENADDFISVLDKYNCWLGDDENEITTFCWSTSDFNQLWTELAVKAKHREDLLRSLKTFVDLQYIFCEQIGAGIPVSLEAALTFIQMKYRGKIHSADYDAINTARILHKIFCTKSLNPSIEYITLDKAPHLKDETMTVLKKVRANTNDSKCSFAAFLSPELLAKFRLTQTGDKETEQDTKTFSTFEDDSILSNSPLAYLAKEIEFINLCGKYRILKSKWIQLATEVMNTPEMQRA